MARLITSGFETGDLTAEGGTATGPCTIVTTTPRSGARCLSVVTSSALAAHVSYALTFTTATDYWARIGINISANPANAVVVLGNATPNFQVRLNTDGTLDLLDTTGTKIGSSSAALTPGTWYRVEVYFNIATSTTGKCELRVNGSTVTGTNVTNANLGTTAPGSLQVGWSATTTSTATILFDDVALNNGTAGAGGTTWPGEGKQVLLVPTADSAIGTGWTQDAGSTTPALQGAVDNEPPVGIADTTASTGAHQVRNATSNANSAYTAAMTTYTAAGVGASDTLTLLQWLVATGAPSATSPKSGSVRIASNPVDTGLASIGTFYQGSTVAGTYPTGWKVTRGAIFDSSNVTMPGSANYGTAPTMSLNQVTASTRIAMCCFMGVYVEYVPGSTAPVTPHPSPVVSVAVTRSSVY